MYPPLLTALPPRLLNLILALLMLVTFFSLTQFSSLSDQAYIPISTSDLSHSSCADRGDNDHGEKHTEEGPDENVGIRPSTHQFDPKIDGTNLFFNDEECSTKFPGLFTEIDIARVHGYVGEAPYRDGDPGFARARIYEGRLYIIDIGDDIYHRMSTLLNQINRAITTAPDPSEIPNIEFQLAVHDEPVANTWALARRNNLEEVTWLMPDHSFWAWPETRVECYAEAREKIDAVDGNLTWTQKKDMAVWRGETQGNVYRQWSMQGLFESAKGKSWSDVVEVDLKTNTSMEMEEFCRYKFLIYSEEATYSSRASVLRRLQHCRSIIIAPALTWRQYHSPLMFSDGPYQNYVKVYDNWSDLDEKIQYYLDNPEEAERVANNSARTFRDQHLTPAGEVCYWRKLFRAWRSVNDDVGTFEVEERGKSWESFVLTRKLDLEAAS